MKSLRHIALGAAILLAVFAAGCKSNNTQTQQQGDQNRQVPSQMAGTQGIITQISADSITIAVMPADSDRQPSGSGAPQQPSGTGKPSGTPPAGDSAKQPTATRDTSSWETKTYAIDSSTKIVQMQFDNSSSAKNTTLKVSDLAVGGSVGIQERAGSAGTAEKITVIQEANQNHEA